MCAADTPSVVSIGCSGDTDEFNQRTVAACRKNSEHYSGHVHKCLSVACFPSRSHACEFLPTQPQPVAGAGILLWDAPTRTVVLGQDYNQEWSDFGGKRDSSDRDSWHTASREAREESLKILDSTILSRHNVIAEVSRCRNCFESHHSHLTRVLTLISCTNTAICFFFFE